MTITRIGSNPNYAAAWDRAFGKKKTTVKAKKSSATASRPKKKKRAK